jgi:hypothetical protein
VVCAAVNGAKKKIKTKAIPSIQIARASCELIQRATVSHMALSTHDRPTADDDGVQTAVKKKVEARVGFEPTSDGFADHSLRPLGYRALLFMPKIYAQTYAQRTLFLPIHAVERPANPLIPLDAASKQGFCRPLPWATWVPRQTF